MLLSFSCRFSLFLYRLFPFARKALIGAASLEELESIACTVVCGRVRFGDSVITTRQYEDVAAEDAQDCHPW